MVQSNVLKETFRNAIYQMPLSQSSINCKVSVESKTDETILILIFIILIID